MATNNYVENEVVSIKNSRQYVSKYGMTIKDGNTPSNIDFSGSSGTFKFPTGGVSGLASNTVDSNAATLTLTQAQSGSVVLLDRAAGTTITLPAPKVGLRFTFIAPVSVTSNNYKIITDAGTTFLLGQVNVFVAAGTAKYFLGDGSTTVAVTMNGTTTGGLAGTQLSFTCINATTWNVDGSSEGSGTVATPFATS